jgi:hypothetical protein
MLLRIYVFLITLSSIFVVFYVDAKSTFYERIKVFIIFGHSRLSGDKVKFIYLGNFYEEFETCKKRLVNRQLSIGALLGNQGGISFTGTFETENSYLGSFFLDPGNVKSCLGVIWNFSKEQGSPELISDCRSKTAH